MSSVIFEYRGIKTTIQCSNSDKMKDICNLYASKINKNISFLLFLYGGNCVNLELNFNEQANKIDRKRNEMNILVFNNDFELKCPKCGERINLEIYDWIKNFKNNEIEKLNELKSQIEILNNVLDINRIRIKVKNINLIITDMIEEIVKSKNNDQKYINKLDEKNNLNNSKNENLTNNNFVNNNEKVYKTPNISESNQTNNIQTQGYNIPNLQKNSFGQPLFNSMNTNMNNNMNRNRFNSRDSYNYMKNNKINTMNNNMYRIMNNKNMNNNMNVFMNCNNMNSNMNMNMSNNNMNSNMNINMSNNNMNINNMFNNNMNNNMNFYTNNNMNYSMNNKMNRNMSCNRNMNNKMNINMYNNKMGNNDNMINNYINNNIFNNMNKNMNNNIFNYMNINMNNWTNVKQNEKNKVKDSFGIYFRCRQKNIFFNLEPDTPLNTVLFELREKFDWLNEINIKGLSFNDKKINLNLSCNQAGIPNEASIDILE